MRVFVKPCPRPSRTTASPSSRPNTTPVTLLRDVCVEWISGMHVSSETSMCSVADRLERRKKQELKRLGVRLIEVAVPANLPPGLWSLRIHKNICFHSRVCAFNSSRAWFPGIDINFASLRLSCMRCSHRRARTHTYTHAHAHAHTDFHSSWWFRTLALPSTPYKYTVQLDSDTVMCSVSR